MPHSHAHWDDFEKADNPSAKDWSRSALVSPLLGGVPTAQNRTVNNGVGDANLDNWPEPDAKMEPALHNRGSRNYQKPNAHKR